MKNRIISAPRIALTSLALAALAASGQASALGLGRLSIQSALGESLKAEIEVTSLTPEEAASLSLKLASPDAYKAGGVEYPAVLASTRATLAQRADGRPVIRLSSDRVVMEPFIDVILEMTWASGRLVREYTLLLDPPKSTGPLAAVTPPMVAATPTAPAPAPALSTAAAPVAPGQPPAAAPAARAPAAAKAEPKPRPSAAADYLVKPGDTLSGISSRLAPSGVSLDQMLVALFRGNPNAFAGGNMNRLKAGAVLAIPPEDAVRQVSAAEAREVILAQSSDFGAYRQRLASNVPAAAEAPARQVTGTVQAAVQDRQQPAAPAPDKLKLTQGSAKAASAPEARLSGDAERKAAADRAAELARNVEELKKLKAAASAAPPAPAPAVAAAPAPAPAPPVLAASAPASVPSGAGSAAVAVSAKPPAPRPAEAPVADEGLMQSILASPLLLPGAGALALLLGAVGLMRVRRRTGKHEETAFLESRNQGDSFFEVSGGQRVDTAEAGPSTLTSAPASMTYSLSHLDAIGDVDPVAEADVYLAYGRDMQAEEILKEAMRVTPDRMAVRLKMLEVYAKRRDTKGFEALAVQLYPLTKGEGPDWARAQELGRSIDADNPLYQPGGRPAAHEPTREADDSMEPSTQPGTQAPTQQLEPPATPLEAFEPPAAAPEQGAIDFDIDLAVGGPAAESAPAPVEPEGRVEPVMDELPGLSISDQPSFEATRRDAGSAPAPADGLDFDLDGLSLDAGTPAPPPVESVAPVAEVSDLSDGLDFDLATSAAAEETTPESEALERKLELADEFRQIGDMEGARDLLTEVAAQAQGTLKAKAEQMLARLG